MSKKKKLTFVEYMKTAVPVAAALALIFVSAGFIICFPSVAENIAKSAKKRFRL